MLTKVAVSLVLVAVTSLSTPAQHRLYEHASKVSSGQQAVSLTAWVSGRVIDSAGRGIAGARIVLTDTETGGRTIASTSSFGYFSIDQVPRYGFYILTVHHPRYSFADNSRVFTLDEDMDEVEFVATP